MSLLTIRQAYNTIKQQATSGQTLKITIPLIQNQQIKVKAYLKQISQSNQFQDLDEITNIQDKYQLLKNTIQIAKSNLSTQAQYQAKIKKVFSAKEINLTHSKDQVKEGENQRPSRMKESSKNNSNQQSSDIRTSEIISEARDKSLDDYFKRVDNQISNKKGLTFKKILNDKDLESVLSPSALSRISHANPSEKSNSRFNRSVLKKKEEEKEVQIKKLLEENKKINDKLAAKSRQEKQLTEFEKNLLKEEKNRYLSKIQELEGEIQMLYRDNYRLKETEKSQHKTSQAYNIQPSLIHNNKPDEFYQPYVIKTRPNDLHKINQKNLDKLQNKNQQQDNNQPKLDYLTMKLGYEDGAKQNSAKDFFNYKPNYGLFEEKFPKSHKPSEKSYNQHQNNKEDEFMLKKLLGDSFQYEQQHQNPKNVNKIQNQSISSVGQGHHFDTFQMASGFIAGSSELGQSRQIANIDPTTSTRNKVAFFKNSLVILRQEDFEIAFKKSDLNESFDKIRLIFYINNKNNYAKDVDINYQYQAEYLKIHVEEKITKIEAKQQGREVLQIQLISKSDLNAVADVHIDINGKRYDLWLPINFIRFQTIKNYHMDKNASQMTIFPDRQFASFENMSHIAPLMFGGKDHQTTWAYLYGRSKFGNFTIKLTWIGKQLSIETTQKWLDYLGFVLHFFK